MFPLTSGYYGDINGPEESHGGFNVGERPAIKLIQSALIKAGCVPGVTDPNAGWADGLFEQPTVDAVKRFQAAHNLTVDGKVGPVTWGALFAPVVVVVPTPVPVPVPTPTPPTPPATTTQVAVVTLKGVKFTITAE